ncbi:MAG: signal transduction histidine kinase [Acidimicrobiales bacterium]|jgi:signal transduction histidine kinase
MISRLLFAAEQSVKYVREHPQILFVLILIVLLPLLFLKNGDRFLDVGKSNQDKLLHERIGLMQDLFVSILVASNYSPEVMQTEIERISLLNTDIVDFKIVQMQGADFVPIAALDTTIIDIPETTVNLYQGAATAYNETLVYAALFNEGRIWSAYRAIQSDVGDFYFIYTQLSLEAVDAVLQSRKRDAYFSLIPIFLFMMALAYWHIKLTDYKYLYIKVQKANEMKDLFTNMIAHELRAPLTAIKGYASMVDESSENEEHKKYAGRIKESSERLLAIVNDLLDVARIQSGKLSVETETFNVSEILMAVIDELHISAQEKNITLSSIGTDSSHLAIGDRKRLHQALTNLLSNSIKYTPKGDIELSIEEKKTIVEIRVKDTGTGISSEDQRKLFAPFFRVQNDDVSQITGTGLGMWITKQLVELMGAKIGVESIKGVGTHIVVTLNKELPKISKKRL